MLFEHFQGFSTKYQPQPFEQNMQISVTCIVQASLAGIKSSLEFITLCRRLFKTWTKVVDSRSNQVSRAKSEFLETEQSPFRFDESCRNRVLRHNNWKSSLDSRLDSFEDRELSVNFLWNGTAVQMTCHFRLGRRMPNFRVSNCMYRVLDGQSVVCEGHLGLFQTSCYCHAKLARL